MKVFRGVWMQLCPWVMLEGVMWMQSWLVSATRSWGMNTESFKLMEKHCVL